MAVFNPLLPLGVALSGGADSSALLVACAAKWPGQVEAIHVHHGLQSAADDFERHCRTLCAQLQVPIEVRRVDAKAAPGQSPEAAARAARYEAFRQFAQQNRAQEGIKIIATGQHADDQVETLLLALSRGAGLPGLAAMPAEWERGGRRYRRPFLRVPGPMLRTWLASRRIGWIDDPTNLDERFTRNRIRTQLLPPLAAAFPHFRETFARSARHAAQAQALLNEVASDDLLGTGCPPHVAALRQLSRSRQANLLRHWLRRDFAVGPSEAQLLELLAQIADCSTRGHRIHLKVADGHVVLLGASLNYLAASPAAPAG
ncbi:MAG: tRNA lysidine(34) synthetase TilS [Polaromonas sp.]|nr:tRNA lysidine(34) synthetase TilS [Polaromonas sp.]